jgi:hypothetical protein
LTEWRGEEEKEKKRKSKDAADDHKVMVVIMQNYYCFLFRCIQVLANEKNTSRHLNLIE